MSIIKLIHRALSDTDIRHILGHDTKIIKYSELAQFTDLDQLLPNPKDYCIILYEDSVDHGHWVGDSPNTTANTSTSTATACNPTRNWRGSTCRNEYRCTKTNTTSRSF